MINEKNDDVTSREKNVETSRKSPFFSNYLQAKIKLISKRYPALHTNIGETWFEALTPEFGKSYFTKVMDVECISDLWFVEVSEWYSLFSLIAECEVMHVATVVKVWTGSVTI